MLEIKVSIKVEGLDRLADALFAIAGINPSAGKEAASATVEPSTAVQPVNTSVQEVKPEPQQATVQSTSTVPEVVTPVTAQAPQAVQQPVSTVTPQMTAQAPQTVSTAQSMATPPVQPMPTSQTVNSVQQTATPSVQHSVQQSAAIPVNTLSYSMDDLTRAAMTLMDAGKQSDLQALLANFGVESLPLLSPEYYGAFATGMRGLGAQI